MAKKIWNDVSNPIKIGEDWGDLTRIGPGESEATSGWQASGQLVQKFITETYNPKFGYIYYNEESLEQYTDPDTGKSMTLNGYNLLFGSKTLYNEWKNKYQEYKEGKITVPDHSYILGHFSPAAQSGTRFNITTLQSFNEKMVSGSSNIFKIYYDAIYGNDHITSTKGVLSLIINDGEEIIVNNSLVSQNEYSIDLNDYLDKLTSSVNDVVVKVFLDDPGFKSESDKTRTWAYKIQVISISVNFSETWITNINKPKSIFTQGTDKYIQASVKCSGVNSYIYYKIDDGEYILNDVEFTPGQEFNINVLVNGVNLNTKHSLSLYAYNKTYNIKSKVISCDFYFEDNKTDMLLYGTKKPSSIYLLEDFTFDYFIYLGKIENSSTITSELPDELKISFDLLDSGGAIYRSNICNAQTLKKGATDGYYKPEGSNYYLSDVRNTILSLDNDIDVKESGTQYKLKMYTSYEYVEGGTTKKSNISSEVLIVVYKSKTNIHETKGYNILFNFSKYTNDSQEIIENNLSCEYYPYVSTLKRDFDLSKDYARSNYGCQKDTSGYSCFKIPANKTLTLETLKNGISWMPFSEEIGYYNKVNGPGLTIEFMFRTSEVSDEAEVKYPFIKCYENSSGTGFKIFSNYIEVYIKGIEYKTYFKTGELIHFGLVIDGNITKCVTELGPEEKEETDRTLGYIYVNGIITRLFDYQGNKDKSLKQINPQNIVFGHPKNTLSLYFIRCYPNYLTMKNMLNNFAFNAGTLAEKIAIATRNSLLDDEGNVILDNGKYTTIKTVLPNTPIITWTIDNLPYNKKAGDFPIYGTVFYNPWWKEDYKYACAPFTAVDHLFKADGTSSNGYPLPYKNFEEKWKNKSREDGGSILFDQDDPQTPGLTYVNKYSIMPGFSNGARGKGDSSSVHKVNFASSEGIFNILAANMYHEITKSIVVTQSTQETGLLTKMQDKYFRGTGAQKDILYRKSLNGFPEIGFQKYTNGNLRFLSIYNLINNKYMGSLFGISDDGLYSIDEENDAFAEVWEVDSNINYFNRELTFNDIKNVSNSVNDDPENDTVWYSRVPKEPKRIVENKGEKVAYGLAEVEEETISGTKKIKRDSDGNIVYKNGFIEANTQMVVLNRFNNWVTSCNYRNAERYILDRAWAKNPDGTFIWQDDTKIITVEVEGVVTERNIIWNNIVDSDYKEFNDPKVIGEISYRYDTPSYRKAKFSNELSSYAHPEDLCFYFIYCDWLLGTDSMDKNMSIMFDNTKPWHDHLEDWVKNCIYDSNAQERYADCRKYYNMLLNWEIEKMEQGKATEITIPTGETHLEALVNIINTNYNNETYSTIKSNPNLDLKARCALRDSDTLCMYNNSGILSFKYYYEWNDVYDINGRCTQIIHEKRDKDGNYLMDIPSGYNYVYNAHLSGLWDLISETQSITLTSIYTWMHDNGLSYSSMIAKYKEFKDKWCEALYNVDGMGYANTGMLDKAHGDKFELVKYFFSLREDFFNSKYNKFTTNDKASIRYASNTNKVWIKCVMPTYSGFSLTSDSNADSCIKASFTEDGTISIIKYLNQRSGGTGEQIGGIFNTQYIADWGGYTEENGEIKYGGMETFCPDGFEISTSLNVFTRLENFIFDYKSINRSFSAYNFENINTLGDLKLLKKVVITNATTIKNIPLSSENLEYIDFSGTPLEGTFTLPQFEDKLKTVILPNTISDITFENYAAFEIFNINNIENINNIPNINIANCPKLNWMTKFDSVYSYYYPSEPELHTSSKLVLNGIDWDATAVEFSKFSKLVKTFDKGNIILKGNIKLNLDDERETREAQLTSLVTDIIPYLGYDNPGDVLDGKTDLYIYANTGDETIYLMGPTEVFEGKSATYVGFKFMTKEHKDFVKEYSIDYKSTPTSTVSIDKNTGKLTSSEGYITNDSEIEIKLKYVEPGLIDNVELPEKTMSVTIKKIHYPSDINKIYVNGDFALISDAEHIGTEYNYKIDLYEHTESKDSIICDWYFGNKLIELNPTCYIDETNKHFICKPTDDIPTQLLLKINKQLSNDQYITSYNFKVILYHMDQGLKKYLYGTENNSTINYTISYKKPGIAFGETSEIWDQIKHKAANDHYITIDECAAINDVKINLNNITKFNEYKYFTNDFYKSFTEGNAFTVSKDTAKLTDITFPNNMENIDIKFISKFNKTIKNISFDTPNQFSLNGKFIVNTSNTAIYCMDNESVEITIPNGIVKLGDHLFDKSDDYNPVIKKLNKIILSNTVRELGVNCLTKTTLNGDIFLNNVNTINKNAFSSINDNTGTSSNIINLYFGYSGKNESGSLIEADKITSNFKINDCVDLFKNTRCINGFYVNTGEGCTLTTGSRNGYICYADSNYNGWVLKVGSKAIYKDNELNAVVLGNECKHLVSYFYQGVNGVENSTIEQITFGENMSEIEGLAFSDCKTIKKFIFNNINDICIGRDGTSTGLKFTEYCKEIVFPNNSSKIGFEVDSYKYGDNIDNFMKAQFAGFSTDNKKIINDRIIYAADSTYKIISKTYTTETLATLIGWSTSNALEAE